MATSDAVICGDGRYIGGADTVAEALGLGKEAVVSLVPYTLGEEQVPFERPKRRALSGLRFSAREADVVLAPLEDDAAAGVPDSLLARRTGVPVHTVARWRRRRGMLRAPGRPSNDDRIRRRAVEVFGRARQPTWMGVETSRVGGKWKIPEYVLRRPLDYGAFAEAMRVLLDEGMDPGRVARGLGVREEDVHLGAAVAGRR